MENKENVCEEKISTEQATEVGENAQGREDGVLNGSAVLGKFKSTDALRKAYESLQAEFTRRSQRLKELERQAENFAKVDAETELADGDSGAVKLRKNARKRAERERNFDRFVAEIENVETVVKPENLECEQAEIPAQVTEENLQNGQEENRNTERTAFATSAGENQKSVAENRGENGDVSEDLYARVMQDEGVRLRVVGEYLTSIGKGAPLMKGGVGAAVAPPLKAKTLEEAGGMALRMFRSQR